MDLLELIQGIKDGTIGNINNCSNVISITEENFQESCAMVRSFITSSPTFIWSYLINVEDMITPDLIEELNNFKNKRKAYISGFKYNEEKNTMGIIVWGDSLGNPSTYKTTIRPGVKILIQEDSLYYLEPYVREKHIAEVFKISH